MRTGPVGKIAKKVTHQLRHAYAKGPFPHWLEPQRQEIFVTRFCHPTMRELVFKGDSR